MAGALDGVKILGFTHFAQGPFALQLLGDLGAEVINIERQGTGDFNRHFQQLDNLGGEGVFFLAMNRNKRSMSLNLKAPESREIVVWASASRKRRKSIPKSYSARLWAMAAPALTPLCPGRTCLLRHCPA